MSRFEDPKPVKLLFEMWRAWAINHVDGDDVFAVFGDQIKEEIKPMMEKQDH